MKKLTLFTCLLFFVLTSGYAQREPAKLLLLPTADSARAVTYTLDALSVITTKCLGCHSPKGRSDKAREALQWELLQNMEGEDALGALDEIAEVLEEGKMPPERMIERYPNMKLTDEETQKLQTWVEGLFAKLEE